MRANTNKKNKGGARTAIARPFQARELNGVLLFNTKQAFHTPQSDPKQNMANAWGASTGAWADEVDDVEEQQTTQAAAAAAARPLDDDAFPSLGAAATSKPKSKKKAQPVPLGAFLGGGAAARRGPVSDKEILLALPKSSSGIGADEGGAPGGLGGAFTQYGGDRGECACWGVRWVCCVVRCALSLSHAAAPVALTMQYSCHGQACSVVR